MATKIRLQRNGRKSYAFYSIVIADVRAPRDGKFTEKIGTYNPNTNPATVDLNFERALHWVMCGAQPTDTVRNILSKKVFTWKSTCWAVLPKAHSQKQNQLVAGKQLCHRYCQQWCLPGNQSPNQRSEQQMMRDESMSDTTDERDGWP